ncbi:hypothetical protein LLH23_00430 [bacterium]|nr:hypothetical protein [bacterium]
MEDLEVLAEVAQTLDGLDVRWMLVGSHASSIWGVFRSTHDIDVVISYEQQHVDCLLQAFQDRYYISREMVEDGLQRGTMWNIIHFDYGEKVDFWRLGNDPYDREALDRRIAADYQGVAVWVASPEDVVLSKLRWAADSRSEMQLNDVSMILRVRRNLDLPYLRLWALRLGVMDDLERLLAEAEEP